MISYLFDYYFHIFSYSQHGKQTTNNMKQYYRNSTINSSCTQSLISQWIIQYNKRLMLERKIKVVRLSQSEEAFVRQYQLADFDLPAENRQESKIAEPPVIMDPELHNILNQKEKPKKNKTKQKDLQEQVEDMLKKQGFSKKQIKEFKKIQQEYDHYTYGKASKRQKRESRNIIKKMNRNKKLADFLEDDVQFPEQHGQAYFQGLINSDEDEQEQVKQEEFHARFVDEKIILESRQRGENKYFLGQLILYNIYAGKIISSELPGRLEVRRQNINRAFHESEVYFQVIQTQQSSDGQATEQEKETIKCRIIAIKTNSVQGKQIVGKVNKFGSNFVFEPINDKIRSMNIVQKPRSENTKSTYYIAIFDEWKITDKFPKCKLIKQFGAIGDIQTECKVLLQMNNVYEADFGPETSQFLKKFTDQTSVEGEYIIPERQYKTRYDLRNQLVFTIDPLTARDFDDALSIKVISETDRKKYGIQTNKQVYQVGIHIADVSYFVEEGSPLDIEAQKRTTSVYLVHRVLPMLPRVLCQTMCSLNPGVQRLVVSVWCYIDQEGNVLKKTRFGRSIINSKARYTYEIAQDILLNKIKPGEVPQGFGAKDPLNEPKLFQAVKLMNNLALKLKSKRTSNGALSIQNHKKQFQLDKNFEPIRYKISQRFQANFLVQQYMLLANIEVANFVSNNLGQATLLRRHMFPSEKKITKFKQFMQKFGLQFQITKQTNLADYFKRILSDSTIKSSTKQLIQYQLVFLLEAAQYFIIGDVPEIDWEHYALGYKRYTHFTSPIRRYPDIIVHRQLLKIIQTNDPAYSLQQKLASKALIQKCNKCKLAARRVSSGCEKIFMCLYLKKHPVNCRGIVTQVGSSSITICIPEYDIKVPILLKNLKNIREKKFNNQNEIKYLYLKHQNNTSSIQLILRQTQYVNIFLSSTNSFPIDYSVKLIFPHPSNPSKSVVIE